MMTVAGKSSGTNYAIQARGDAGVGSIKYMVRKYWVHCNTCGALPVFYRGFYSVGQLCKKCLVGRYERYIYEEGGVR